MLYEVITTILNQDNTVICEADVRIACLNNQTMKPALIADQIIAELNA